MGELSKLTIADARDKLRAKEFTAQELAQDCLIIAKTALAKIHIPAPPTPRAAGERLRNTEDVGKGSGGHAHPLPRLATRRQALAR